MKKIVLATILAISQLSVAQSKTSTRNMDSQKEQIKVNIVNGQIDQLTDVVYSQIISQRNVRPLKMTLLVPRNNKLKPAIVYFPGGGFTSADRDKFFEMKNALAEAGFVVAGADYRVVPDVFPALINDGKAAIRYLKAHAEELGIDPDKIGVLGDSAGGYMAQMMGATNGEKGFDTGDFLEVNSDVQSVVSLYGISNLLNIGEGFSKDIQEVHESPASTEALLVNGPAFKTFVGASISKFPEKAFSASPMGHIKKNMPPFLLLHGDADQLVSYDQSIQMYNALKKSGNVAKLITVNGAGHGDLYWYQPEVIHKVVDWFKQTLGEPIENPNKTQQTNSNL